MNKTLHIFDLDDTLLITPTFGKLIPTTSDKTVDLTGEFSEFFNEVKSFFYIVFSKEIYFVAQGDYIVIYDNKTKAPLSTDYLDYIHQLNPDSMSTYGLKRSSVKNIIRVLDTENNHIVFKSIHGFHEKPETVGSTVNDQVFKDYNAAENKMILTGRKESLRPFIEQRLKTLGLDFPNYGLFLFPGGSTSVQNYKIQTILKAIQEYNWSEIHFYEDRVDWLESAQKEVQAVFPNVKFVPHIITLSKELRSL
jgi:hypothetical protein